MYGLNILWMVLALRGPATESQPEPEPEPAESTQDAPDGDAPDDGDAANDGDPAADGETPGNDDTIGDDALDDGGAAVSADPFDNGATSEPAPAAREPATASPRPEPAPTVTSGSALRRKQHTYPDLPIRWRLDLGIAGGTTFVPDTAFFAFTPGRRHLTGFTIDGRIDFPIIEGRAFIGGGLSYRRTGRSDGLYDGRLDTTLLVQDPLALGRFSFRFTDGIDAYAQVSGGPSIIDITTSNSSVDRNGSQRKVTGAFEAVGGLAVYLPKKWLPRKGSSRLTAGFDAALGYGFRGRLDVAPNLETEDDVITTTSTSLGDVALRGLVWRAGLFVRFM